MNSGAVKRSPAIWVAFVGMVALLAGSLVGLEPVASAAVAPAVPTSVCVDGTCTVTYATVGTGQGYTVPAFGVTSLQVSLYGGQGAHGDVRFGSGASAPEGGDGALVTGEVPQVTPSQSFTVDVGGVGGSPIGGTPGVNGGGKATFGGGGGGASDILSGYVLLFEAGGGGGGGSNGNECEALDEASVAGGNGGNADTVGQAGHPITISTSSNVLGGGAPGQPGTSAAEKGGTGGAGGVGTPTDPCGGTTSTGSRGGDGSDEVGGAAAEFGGGGGGGLFGGGAGGDGASGYYSDMGGSGGGGGGSSYLGSRGVSQGVLDDAGNSGQVNGGNGEVILSYTDPIAAATPTVSTPQGQMLSVPATAGLLQGSSGPSGDPLTVTGPSGGVSAQGGTVTVASDGSFTYTPKTGFGGADDSFGFTVADQSGNYASGTVTVHVVAPQPLSFGPPPTGAVSGETYTPMVTAATTTPVMLSIDTSSGPGVCSLSQAKVTFLLPGSCVIDADQAASADFTAGHATQTIPVGLLGQTISGFSPASPAFTGSTAQLTATGGPSGSPVTFSVDTTSGAGVCSVSGTNGATVTYLKPGTCVLDANQASSGIYGQAQPAQATVMVVDKSPTTTTLSPPPTTRVGEPVTLSAAVSSTAGPAGLDGTVAFTVNGATVTGCATQALTGGIASCTTSALPAGADSVTAIYSGDATHAGSTSTVSTVTVTGDPAGGSRLASTPDGKGWWVLNPDNSVSAYGTAVPYGSPAAQGLKLSAPAVGITATPDGHGYWIVAADGGVFGYGDAHFEGSAAGLRLAKPVVGLAATPDGTGYWLVASDGGVFSYGTAAFQGSAGNLRLASPVDGIAATPDGTGYWLVASDGGVFNYGTAPFAGSAANLHPYAPVIGITRTPDGRGYWLVASDGGVFNYGHAGFYGAQGGVTHPSPIEGIIAHPSGTGYSLVTANGAPTDYGS